MEKRSFISSYLTLRSLQFDLNDNISLASTNTIIKLEDILRNGNYSTHRCSYFLYRLAVEILADIISNHPDKEIKKIAYKSLKNVLFKNPKTISIATAEALSNLPLDIKGPDIGHNKENKILSLTIKDILSHLKNDYLFYKKEGRSLIFKDITDRLFVLKVDKNQDKVDSLSQEIIWMCFLKKIKHKLEEDFLIPLPFKINGNFLFYLKDIKSYGIGYFVTKDYFRYPNHPPLPSVDILLKILSKASYLFGKLTSLGIIHTAPIPLFHNRTESHRRDDGGIYLWTRGGRLDRWLDSCWYPNFGFSGLRDFEHFISFKGTNRELFRLIGNHFLGMFLVLGSYFRAKAPEKKGFYQKNQPYDLRILFDKDVLKKGLYIILEGYFKGFVGDNIFIPLAVDNLVDRMVEEMGVDRYMEEMFRTQDQEGMDDEEFKNFLIKMGIKAEKAKILKKGEKDIILYTGPHLGEFNGRISLPEILEFTAICTATCMLHRSLKNLQLDKKDINLNNYALPA